MPRIDPAQLLKTLGVLLGPNGGIKSTEEVSIFSRTLTQISSSTPFRLADSFS